MTESVGKYSDSRRGRLERRLLRSRSRDSPPRLPETPEERSMVAEAPNLREAAMPANPHRVAISTLAFLFGLAVSAGPLLAAGDPDPRGHLAILRDVARRAGQSAQSRRFFGEDPLDLRRHDVPGICRSQGRDRRQHQLLRASACAAPAGSRSGLALAFRRRFRARL